MFDEEFAQLGAPICAIGAVGAEVQRLPMRWAAPRRLGSNEGFISQRNEAFHHEVRVGPVGGAFNRVVQRGPAVIVYLEKQRSNIMVLRATQTVLGTVCTSPDTECKRTLTLSEILTRSLFRNNCTLSTPGDLVRNLVLPDGQPISSPICCRP